MFELETKLVLEITETRLFGFFFKKSGQTYYSVLGRNPQVVHRIVIHRMIQTTFIMVTQDNVFTICTLQFKINAFSDNKLILKPALVLVEPQTIFHKYNAELQEGIIFRKCQNDLILIIFKPIPFSFLISDLQWGVSSLYL